MQLPAYDPCRGVGERAAQRLCAAVGLLGVAAPVVYLACRRGGVDATEQAAAFVWVLALTSLLCVAGPWLGLRLHATWPVVLLPGLPLLQLIPLGTQGSFPPFYTAIGSQFAELGVDPWGAVSVYPHATLRASLTVAGCCALFVLARSLNIRSQRCFWPIALPLVLLGTAEAVLGLQQFLSAKAIDDSAGTVARGTLVNRDHYAALLEGCLALALGFGISILETRGRDSWTCWRLASGPLVAAGLCLLAIILSFSRAGILVAALITVAALALVAARSRATATALAVLVVAAAMTASAMGVAGLSERFAELLAQGQEGSRISIWRDTLRSATPYSWTGSGLGTFAFVFQRSGTYLPLKTVDHAHSDYLETLVELGWPAALLLLGALCVSMAQMGRRIVRMGGTQPGSFALGCWLGVAAILVHACVDFPLRIPAVAALLAVLAGSAAGLTAGRSRRSGAPTWAAGLASGVFALVGIGLLLGAGRNIDAQAIYEQGSRSMINGQWQKADALYVEALRANPFAAKVWLERAEIAEIAGDRERAARLARLARRLEPRTLRMEWPLANLYLRLGNFENAAVPLRVLADGIPAMRATVFDAAWRAGMPPALIARRVVPATGAALGEYLCYLARRGRWRSIVPAYRELNSRNEQAVPDEMMQYTLARLLSAGQESERKQLQDLL